MRAKSFSAEKRQIQDRQAFIAFGILLAVTIFGWLFDALQPYCNGALQGAWSPLFVLMLRYTYRVVSRRRIDLWAVADAAAFIAAFVLISVYLYPRDIWHAAIMLLCLVSTVRGVQSFRFTPLFMFLNCLVAGAILL